MAELKLAEQWVAPLVEDGLPILSPQETLEFYQYDEAAFIDVIGSDPLLAMQLFQWTRYLPTFPPEGVFTITEVVSRIGIPNILARTSALERMEMFDPSRKRLLQFMVDALVAATLLRCWHMARSIPWDEMDYWSTVFANKNWWLLVLKDMDALEQVEDRICDGEPVNSVFLEIYGFSYDDLDLVINREFRVPALEKLVQSAQQADGSGSPRLFKYQAMKFLMPISHQLAGCCRAEWGSDHFHALVSKAARATLIEHFGERVAEWVAQAPGRCRLPAVEQTVELLYHKAISEFRRRHESAGSSEPDVPAVEFRASEAEIGTDDLPLQRLQPEGGDVSGPIMESGPEASEHISAISDVCEPLCEYLLDSLNGEGCFVAFPAGGGFVILSVAGDSYERARGAYFGHPDSGWLAKLLLQSSSLHVEAGRAVKARTQLPEPLATLLQCPGFFVKSFAIPGDQMALAFFVPAEDRSDSRQAYLYFRKLVGLAEMNLEGCPLP